MVDGAVEATARFNRAAIPVAVITSQFTWSAMAAAKLNVYYREVAKRRRRA
jgi:hypothetical protein